MAIWMRMMAVALMVVIGFAVSAAAADEQTSVTVTGEVYVEYDLENDTKVTAVYLTDSEGNEYRLVLNEVALEIAAKHDLAKVKVMGMLETKTEDEIEILWVTVSSFEVVPVEP